MKWKIVFGNVGDAAYVPQRKEWVQIALAAASAVSSMIGGAKSKAAAEKAEREQRYRENAENAWYQRKYNENYADTAAGRAIISEAKDYARENWKKASGAAAVTGGTDAATAQAKEAGNKMVGNAVRTLAAQDTARKDNLDAQHMKMQDNFAQQRIANYQARADATAQTAAGMSNAMMSAASAMGGGNKAGGTNGNLVGGSNGGTAQNGAVGNDSAQGSAPLRNAPAYEREEPTWRNYDKWGK